jgi:hypothetical protein
MDKVEYLSSLMSDYGMSPTAQAALLGNIHAETGGTYEHTTKQKGGKGYGLFQFDSHMKPYKAMLKSEGLKDSPDAQMKYFMDTVYGDKQDIIGKGVAAQIRNALEKEQDPFTLTQVLSDNWFRPGKPNYEARMNATQMYVPAIQQPNTTLDELLGGFKYLGNMFNFGK